MKFNLRIMDGHKYYNDCLSYYYIGSRDQDAIDKLSSLNLCTIYGEDFKDVKKSIRAEFKKEASPQLEMTAALKVRFSAVEKKINELMMLGETVHRVFFHYNSEMSKPMIITVLGVRTGAISGIEQGRVIVSGVDTIIEQDHFVHGNRCDFYEGSWKYINSKSGNQFIEIDMTKNERPIAYRGK